jgi:hypothetical protein
METVNKVLERKAHVSALREVANGVRGSDAEIDRFILTNVVDEINAYMNNDKLCPRFIMRHEYDNASNFTDQFIKYFRKGSPPCHDDYTDEYSFWDQLYASRYYR